MNRRLNHPLNIDAITSVSWGSEGNQLTGMRNQLQELVRALPGKGTGTCRRDVCSTTARERTLLL